jgi:DNA-binding transcriptional ArsR family regulator
MEPLLLKTLDEIKVYSDPYRISIVHAFKRMGRPATVKEVADAMDEPPGKVYYHVKKLEQVGIVTVKETRTINGIIAKYYELYEGDIQIMQREFEPAHREMYYSETRKLIGELFDTTRNTYLARVAEGKQPDGKITNRTLRMTKEKAADFYERLDQFLGSFDEPDAPGTLPYDFFVAVMVDAPSSEKDDPKEPDEPRDDADAKAGDNA